MLKFLAIALLTTVAVAPYASAQTAASNPAASQKEPAFKAKKLSRAELDALLAHPDQILLIDVRRPDEIAQIGGFPVYLNVQIGDLKNQLAYIPKDRTIITISNHAARAGVAADLLTDNGFHVAGAVGAQLYEADGGTLVKISPPKPRTATAAAANPPTAN
jgi:rhodanese-related sulfurtransferase